MTRVHRLFLRGQWRQGSTGEFRSVINPATEQEVARVACATSADLDEAITSAAQSARDWRNVSPEERGRLLVRGAERLQSRIDAASALLSEEQGKTVAEAREEFARAVDTIVWSGQQAGALCAPVTAGNARWQLPEPAGVVAAFTPWNYPAVVTARKLAPALAAGCPVILKAAEEAPSAAVAIVAALEEAGLPPGVLSLVFGDPPKISSHLLASPIVRVVTFTGSTRVGRELATAAAPQLQRCLLELGGHAPVIVLDDADVDAAVQAIATYKFKGAGQSCNTASRLLVQRGVYEAVVQRLTAVAKGIRVGPGNDPETQMGPVATPRGLATLERLIADAVARGAIVTAGGSRLKRSGYFWPPTILRDVPPDAAIMHDEPFGPILPIVPFGDVAEAVSIANASRYGLAAYVFTRSQNTATRIVGALSVGSVGVNQLKGVAPDLAVGGLNDSGYGYEGGVEGFRAFQSLKVVSAKEERDVCLRQGVLGSGSAPGEQEFPENRAL
jgi:succinate-semialdehyde dehydrogenase / glutarate-semialdehyde dehydrogenase